MNTRAAVMHEPGSLVVEELDVDEPLPGEVVVRMSAVGVCGTDLHSYKGEWNRPTTNIERDIVTGGQVGAYKHPGEVLCLAVSRKGNAIAAGGGDKSLSVWTKE